MAEAAAPRQDPQAAAPQKLAELVAHLEALDAQLVRLGDDEWITGYQMQTGAWHRILGLIRGSPAVTAAQLAAQIPNQRMVEEKYRKAREVSQASMNYEVRGGPAPSQEAPPLEPSEDAINAAFAKAPHPNIAAALQEAYNVDRGGGPAPRQPIDEAWDYDNNRPMSTNQSLAAGLRSPTAEGPPK